MTTAATSKRGVNAMKKRKEGGLRAPAKRAPAKRSEVSPERAGARGRGSLQSRYCGGAKASASAQKTEIPPKDPKEEDEDETPSGSRFRR